VIGAEGYGSGLNANRASTFVSRLGLHSGRFAFTGRTRGSSERRNAMMPCKSSSDMCGSLTIHGGVYLPSRRTPVRSR